MLRDAERLVFDALCRAHPDFAGGSVRWEDGPDPPDYVGTYEACARRIGVELGEWLNEAQMRGARLRERTEDSFLTAIRSEMEAPPQNVGQVCLSLRDGALHDGDAFQFRNELLDCIRRIDAAWTTEVERNNPSVYEFAEFSSFPCLQRYLTAIELRPAHRIPALEGVAWIVFSPSGCPYMPQPAVEALLRLLDKKTRKYSHLRVTVGLDELWLVAYWNQGLVYNTPFFAPGFGFQDVAGVAREAMAANPGPFQRVFLFNALPQDLDLTLIYPRLMGT